MLSVICGFIAAVLFAIAGFDDGSHKSDLFYAGLVFLAVAVALLNVSGWPTRRRVP